MNSCSCKDECQTWNELCILWDARVQDLSANCPRPASLPPYPPQVVMSQRLGSSLRRKVSETETQLLALQEAKLAAISGNPALPVT